MKKETAESQTGIATAIEASGRGRSGLGGSQDIRALGAGKTRKNEIDRPAAGNSLDVIADRGDNRERGRSHHIGEPGSRIPPELLRKRARGRAAGGKTGRRSVPCSELVARPARVGARNPAGCRPSARPQNAHGRKRADCAFVALGKPVAALPAVSRDRGQAGAGHATQIGGQVRCGNGGAAFARNKKPVGRNIERGAAAGYEPCRTGQGTHGYHCRGDTENSGSAPAVRAIRQLGHDGSAAAECA